MVEIKVGRMIVRMTLRKDERIIRLTGGRRVAYMKLSSGDWLKLGAYDSEAEAMKAIYVEREDFSAAYGCES